MGTYYVTKESQEIAGCRLIRYGIGCRWREILGLSHNRQAVEWLVERCNRPHPSGGCGAGFSMGTGGTDANDCGLR